MDGLILQIIIFAILFCVGFGFGRYNEGKHFRYLDEQEQRLAYIRVNNSRFAVSGYSGQMISSNVVISHDYFKYAIANVQNILGGRLTSYESVVERARREAIVRLKLEAEKIGATQIMGIRLSTTELGMQGGMVEVFAYGTAIQQPAQSV
ncbi:YbjQ family protein [Acinetobacter lwoffii]|uniref:YbjQ family protein n=1 Tax=Acinetobacter lwoffii TaxID=28090 RepID=A0AAJ4P570_ACILW|nr:heavy metal-binding domain-containing protein [Acinetobacter sp. NEB149]QJB49263.1 YbjQ family protein [Acinetobacter sp. NEB149]QXR08229.1 YbjQ family protein [Acinetobacter lwoffii]